MWLRFREYTGVTIAILEWIFGLLSVMQAGMDSAGPDYLTRAE